MACSWRIPKYSTHAHTHTHTLTHTLTHMDTHKNKHTVARNKVKIGRSEKEVWGGGERQKK